VIELPTLVLEALDALASAAGPVLLNRDPAPGEDEVPRRTAIAIELAVLADDPLDVWSVRVWVADALAFDGTAAMPIQPPFAGTVSAWRHDDRSCRVVLDPLAPFESRASIRVRVVATSAHGGQRVDESYAFTVEDKTPPALVAAIASGLRTLRLVFDKPVALGDDATFVIERLDRPAVGGTVIEAFANGTLLELALAAPLTPDARYLIRVSGVSDVLGNALAAPADIALFNGFRPPRPAGRRFDLFSMLSKHHRRNDAGGDLARLLSCFQEVTELLLAELDAIPDLFDIERAPERVLDAILRDLGNPFAFELTELQKRRLAAILVGIYREKGTAPGIKNAARFFLGLDDVAVVPLAATALVLGESALGEDWELGPSTRFARYAFEIAIGRVLTDNERAALLAIVRYMKPSHTHLARIVEPSIPPTFDHWEIGISELGLTTLLH
jgi:phage tail-like protein